MLGSVRLPGAVGWVRLIVVSRGRAVSVFQLGRINFNTDCPFDGLYFSWDRVGSFKSIFTARYISINIFIRKKKSLASSFSYLRWHFDTSSIRST